MPSVSLNIQNKPKKGKKVTNIKSKSKKKDVRRRNVGIEYKSKLTPEQLELAKRVYVEAAQEERLQKRIIIAVMCFVFLLFLIVVALLTYFYIKESSAEETVVSEVEANETTTFTSRYTSTSTTSKPLHPLGNLTEACLTLGKCYYHPPYYPANCRKTNCMLEQALHFEVADNGQPLFQPTYNQPTNKKEVKVPEFTICAPGNWCVNGDCVATDDPRAKVNSDDAPTVFGLGDDCHTPHCIGNGILNVRAGGLTLLRQFAGCPKLNVCDVQGFRNKRDVISIHFLSCRNPVPFNVGDENYPRNPCINYPLYPDPKKKYVTTTGYMVPVLPYKVCQVCPNKVENVGGKCIDNDKNPQPVGTPCYEDERGHKNWNLYPSYCVAGYCLPLVEKSPHVANFAAPPDCKD